MTSLGACRNPDCRKPLRPRNGQPGRLLGLLLGMLPPLGPRGKTRTVRRRSHGAGT